LTSLSSGYLHRTHQRQCLRHGIRGGIDIGLSRHLAIRAVQVDYLRTQFSAIRRVNDRTLEQPRQSAEQLPLLYRYCISILKTLSRATASDSNAVPEARRDQQIPQHLLLVSFVSLPRSFLIADLVQKIP